MNLIGLLCLVIAAATTAIWIIYMGVFLSRTRRGKSPLPKSSGLASKDNILQPPRCDQQQKGLREERDSQNANWKELVAVEGEQEPSGLSRVSALLGVGADLLMAVCVCSKIGSGREVRIQTNDGYVLVPENPRYNVANALDFGNMSTGMFLALVLGLVAVVIGVIGARQGGKTGPAVLGIIAGAFVLAVPFLIAAFIL
jgi:hypothetical protein